MVPDLVQLGSRSGKKAECHEIHAGWLGSGLGSTWFHLVPEVAEKQHPTISMQGGLVPVLVPLGSRGVPPGVPISTELRSPLSQSGS